MIPEEKLKRLNKAYRSVFNSDDGEFILDDLKKLSRYDLVLVPVGNDGHIDIHDIMRNEGMRSVVIHILKKMETKDEPRQTEAISKE